MMNDHYATKHWHGMSMSYYAFVTRQFKSTFAKKLSQTKLHNDAGLRVGFFQADSKQGGLSLNALPIL